MSRLLRRKVRAVALTIVAPTSGFLIVLALEVFLKIELSKLVSSIVNLLVVALVAFELFPKRLGIPFGRIETREFLKRTGFHFPHHASKHIVLGLILAACTLSGMLTASILTGKYEMDIGTINLPHLVFCLNPALWEELFYRGVLMFLLLKFTRSLKQALVIQVISFGLTHIKGVDIGALVDSFSVTVLAVGFTYTAYKTRSLVAGIVFHYFHDALLFFAQLPDGIYTGVTDNAMFYGILWLMVAIACVITKLAAERCGVRAPTELYSMESV
jgi:membrane protease YdiL (CAAX protease family)